MRARRLRKSALLSGRLGILPAAWSFAISRQAASYRLVAWRRKITPSTGIQYSEEDLCALARRSSAVFQRQIYICLIQRRMLLLGVASEPPRIEAWENPGAGFQKD